MNKRLQFILSILLLFFLKTGISQPYPEWEQFLPTDNPIWRLNIKGNKLYCLTHKAGLIEYNMETKTTIQHTDYNPGLASLEISDVFVDNAENIWVGHWESGVTKIHGGIGQVFNSDNSGLQCDSVSSIRVDHNNKVWIGTEKGLDVFDGENWIHYNMSNSDLPSNIIRTIEVDKENNKWIGCKSGFSIYNDIEWETHPPEGFYSANFEEIAITDEGIAYIEIFGANSYLYKFQNDRLEYLGWPSANNRICDIVLDNIGNVWMPISGPNFSLGMYDGNCFTEFDSDDYEQFASNCFSIAIDDENNQWLGFDNIGLHKFDHTSFEKITDGIFSCKSAEAISIKNDNSVWFGAYENFMEYHSGEWKNANDFAYGFDISEVRDIDMNSQGQTWVAGGSEAIVFDEFQWFVFNETNSPLTTIWPDIHEILVDANDILWVAENGLLKYDDGEWSSFNFSNSAIPFENVLSLAMDSANNLWLGGLEGIASFDGQVFHHYPATIGETVIERVQSICVDSVNTKWIGSEHGLIVYDNEEWIMYDTLNSGLPYNTINVIQIDQSGNVWIGTDKGIGVLKENSWTVYNNSNSALPSNFIFDIEVTESNTIWISTSEGIARYNQNGFLDMEEFPSNHNSIVQLRCYPNPFSEFTNIAITTHVEPDGEVVIFNNFGKVIRSFNAQNKMQWDGKDEMGKEVKSGIYYCCVKSNKQHNFVKIVKQ